MPYSPLVNSTSPYRNIVFSVRDRFDLLRPTSPASPSRSSQEARDCAPTTPWQSFVPGASDNAAQCRARAAAPSPGPHGTGRGAPAPAEAVPSVRISRDIRQPARSEVDQTDPVIALPCSHSCIRRRHVFGFNRHFHSRKRAANRDCQRTTERPTDGPWPGAVWRSRPVGRTARSAVGEERSR